MAVKSLKELQKMLDGRYASFIIKGTNEPFELSFDGSFGSGLWYTETFGQVWKLTDQFKETDIYKALLAGKLYRV